MIKNLNSRTAESEYHAFSRLGLGKPIITERELINMFFGSRVPEALFNHKGKILSVEVKRIIGNALPDCGDSRRKIKRLVRGKEQIVWPWTSSVETALSKLDIQIATQFNVDMHLAVFLLPDYLNNSVRQRVIKHIHNVAVTYLSEGNTSTKVKYYIITCDGYFFDRT